PNSIRTASEDIEMNVVPNPNNGVFELRFTNTIKDATLIITDMIGREVYNSAINTQRLTIDLSVHANGMYYVTINSNGKQFRKKVMINK
ncbi:MAG: T9SS type A sorting domain-containing protein, partial [Flavobacterium sp.]